jgi:hypothetical protein
MIADVRQPKAEIDQSRNDRYGRVTTATLNCQKK